jgi:hypothetical protein
MDVEEIKKVKTEDVINKQPFGASNFAKVVHKVKNTTSKYDVVHLPDKYIED